MIGTEASCEAQSMFAAHHNVRRPGLEYARRQARFVTFEALSEYRDHSSCRQDVEKIFEGAASPAPKVRCLKRHIHVHALEQCKPMQQVLNAIMYRSVCRRSTRQLREWNFIHT